ncbi:MAG TPA: hypothetical protein VMH86_10470 [Rhizomicrobium sp.]|nr:hypothetical protein [Rhizomicrobium sp.]
MAVTPPSTRIVPGIAAGQAHAVAVATQMMTQTNALEMQNATQTQGGMQKINTVTTSTMLSLIAAAG